VPSVPVKTCLSFLPASKTELNGILKETYSADLIELRLDHLNDIPFSDIRKSFKQPVIITLRMPEEGGFWKYTSEKRIPLFQAALDSGMDYIDLEWKYSQSILDGLVLKDKSKVILSHHTSERNFDNLLNIYEQMKKIPADIYKLIFTANDINDNLVALQLQQMLKDDAGKFIIHAMGEPGKISRILGALRGNAWTYVSQDSVKETASGQLSVNEFNAYHLAEKSSHTRIIGLVGYPIAQSFGWILHNKLTHICKQKMGETFSPANDFIYLNFPVMDFHNFWEKWKDIISGLSITIPHKEKVTLVADVVSPEVQSSGVCNTILKRDDKWYGHNTDYLAIADLLKPYLEKLQEGVLIIGTGGTARTSIAVLKDLGIESVFITGRNEERGLELSKIFSVSFLSREELGGNRIAGMIQTTPVGMYPKVNEIPEEAKLLKPGQIVLDVIFNPAKTEFLKAAEKLGCKIISGRDMYLNQAWRQFQLFSGLEIDFYLVEDAAREIWGNLE